MSGLVFIFVLLQCFSMVYRSEGGKHGPYRMDEDVYNCVLDIANGQYCVSVKQRSTFDRKCYMRWYRHRREFSVREGELYFRDRMVTVDKAKDRVMKRELENAKGIGARPLYHRLKNKYAGISERAIQSALSINHTHQLLHKTFKNKPPPQPINAYAPQERNQIDLMDMGKQRQCTYNNRQYRYILTIMDVYSRYVWLHALPSKSSGSVRKALEKTYEQHGKPRIIQCDQGTEFKGQVSTFATKHMIKVIRSSPYHPQSQGKVERCHRILRKKIAYDIIKSKQSEQNWRSRLQAYASAMNLVPKRPLQYKTPFEVYFGRPHNKDLPCDNTSNHHLKRVHSLRKQINRATKVNNDKVTKHHKNNYDIFQTGDKVLIKTSRSKHKKHYRLLIALGKILKIGRGHRYFVEWKAVNGSQQKRWTSVTELSKLRSHETKSTTEKKSGQRNKYYIPLTHRDVLFSGTEFSVVLNPDGDGNCQFVAAADQLRRLGIEHSGHSLRHAIIKYIREHANIPDLRNYIEGNDIDTYLEGMSQINTYGDHITLQAIADLFAVNVQVVLPSGANYCILTPQYVMPIDTIQLGYLPEGQGDHYVSILANGVAEPAGESTELVDGLAETETDQIAISDLPLELIVHICSYVASVDLSSRQKVRCVSSQFNSAMNVAIHHLPRPSIYLAPHIMAAIRLRPETACCSVSVCRLLRAAGYYSGLALRLRRLMKTSDWHCAWLVLISCALPGWFDIVRVYWRVKGRRPCV